VTTTPARANHLPAVTIVAHDVGSVGGMERQISRLVSGLLDAGHAVTIVARSCELPPRENFEFVRVRAPQKPFAVYYPWFMLAAAAALRRARRGVLHATGAIVLSQADVSTVHFCHHAYQAVEAPADRRHPTAMHRLNGWIARVMSRTAERLCYRPRWCRRLVAVSGGVASEVERFLPAARGSVSVIPNGVDRDRFQPDAGVRSALRAELGIADDELMALFVGGDWERKGLRLAIEALAGAPAWRLVVVGEGDLLLHQRMAAEAGVADRVTFAGRRTDTERFYSAADAFVLATAYEAFPLVALEAAASGLAMVCTRVNGVEDLIEHETSGLLVGRDAPSIGAALGRLSADPALRARLGAAARGATEEYDWQRVVERYSELYAQQAGVA
jgi:glycosyltransferase involved in cell wall biosynthesis